MEPRHYYRPDEFAERFRISRRSVYRMIKKKRLRVVIIGNMIRIPQKEYCRFCEGANGCTICPFKP